jgi:hypothetical protein
MGLTISKLLSRLVAKKEMRILMVRVLAGQDLMAGQLSGRGLGWC